MAILLGEPGKGIVATNLFVEPFITVTVKET